MFGLFDDKKTKLERKYKKLAEQSYQLSHTDRKASDLKAYEAEAVLKQIEELEQSDASHK